MRIRTPKDVGAAIRERRRALGLDQQSLAKRVGVSRKWVIEMEKGKPRAAMRLVLRTLEALGLVLTTDDALAQPPPGTRLAGSAIDVDAVVQAHRQGGPPR